MPTAPPADAYTAGTDALAVLRSVDGDRARHQRTWRILVHPAGRGWRRAGGSASSTPNQTATSVRCRRELLVRGARRRIGTAPRRRVRALRRRRPSPGERGRRPADVKRAAVHARWWPLPTSTPSSAREGGDAADITPYGTSRWEVIETGAAYALSVDVKPRRQRDVQPRVRGDRPHRQHDVRGRRGRRRSSSGLHPHSDTGHRYANPHPDTTPPRRSQRQPQRRRPPQRQRQLRHQRRRRTRCPASSPGWKPGYRRGKRGWSGCRRSSSRSAANECPL